MTTTGEPLPDLQEREAAYERFVWSNLRRNYIAHFLHGMMGMTGFRLLNAPTFIPAYLALLSGSDVVVGLGLALMQFGAIVGPVFGATRIEYRRRLRGPAIFMGWLVRLQILGIAVVGWIFKGNALLLSTLLFLFLFGLFMGPQRVAFQSLLAKVIPLSRRGRLLAWRNSIGGALAALLSYFAGTYMLENNVLGNGYATTFLFGFILTSMGISFLGMFMKETDSPTVRPRQTVRERMRDFPTLLMSDKGFFYYLIARGFAVAGRIAAPFYILYAAETVSLSGTTIGLLSLAFLGADTVANILWGYLADRSGFHTTFKISVAIGILSTIGLMLSGDLTFIFIAFCGLGASTSGYDISANGMVLEFGHRDDLPMRLAMSHMAEGVVAAASPLIGGVIAALLGYNAVFIISITTLGFALYLLSTVIDNPRKRANTPSTNL